MNLSNDYMFVLDEIRKAKKIPVANLCEDIITERTYYRMLSANQVRTDVFSLLLNRLGVDLTEFIHYTVFVRKSDSRFKFIYRVHTKYYRDIEEHYQAMLLYQDSVEELDLLIKVYIKKYEYDINQINQDDYHNFLRGLIPTIQHNSVFNIYLFTIELILLKEIPKDYHIPLKDLASNLFKEEFSYSVILVAICYDELFMMLMLNRHEDDQMVKLMTKFEVFINYFPSRYFLMRYNLYQAYLGYITKEQTLMQNYLYKYLMNALSMIEEKEYQEQFKQVEEIFQLDVTNFLYEMTKEKLVL